MTDIAKSKAQLEQRLTDLVARMAGIDAELVGHDAKDWPDLATERESDQVLERMGLDAQTEVRAITSALRRIQDGSYGFCLRCGNRVEPARLDLLPVTPFCKDHAT